MNKTQLIEALKLNSQMINVIKKKDKMQKLVTRSINFHNSIDYMTNFIEAYDINE